MFTVRDLTLQDDARLVVDDLPSGAAGVIGRRYYDRQAALWWFPGEVPLATDEANARLLTVPERRMIEYVLGFFWASDALVGENVGSNFGSEITDPDVRAAYALQGAMEAIHQRMYSALVRVYVPEADQRERLKREVISHPTVSSKIAWVRRWLDRSSGSLAQRLFAFACVEGIFFCSSFCAIFYLRAYRPGVFPGLYTSNQFISRDEFTHTQMAVELLRGLLRAGEFDTQAAEQIIRSAVDCERQFVQELLVDPPAGMDAEQMLQYVQFVADRLLTDVGLPVIYGASNPFGFMRMQEVDGHHNFFERVNAEYTKANTRQPTTLVTPSDEF